MKKILEHKFIKNVLTVLSGALAVQVLNFAFIPIITRIYSPEEFGVFSSFIAVFNIIAPISAFCLPIAIIQPKSHNKAIALFQGVIVVSCIFSVLALCVVFILDKLNYNSLPEYIIYFIPLSIFFYSIQQVCQHWLIREGKYKEIRLINVKNVLALNLMKLVGGIFNPIYLILVLSTVLSYIIHSVMYMKASGGIELLKKKSSYRTSLKIIHEYKDFILYRTPQVFFNSLSRNFPVFFMGAFFGLKAAAFFSLTQSTLTVPITIIGNSLSNVFYPLITKKIKDGSNYTLLILKSVFSLFFLGGTLFSVIIIYGVDLFSYVFGSEWARAGEYAQWISIWFIFWLSSRPVIDAVPALNLQKMLLKVEVVSMILKALSLFIGYYFFKSDLSSVKLFCLTSLTINIFTIILVLKKAYVKERNYERLTDGNSLSNN